MSVNFEAISGWVCMSLLNNRALSRPVLVNRPKFTFLLLFSFEVKSPAIMKAFFCRSVKKNRRDRIANIQAQGAFFLTSKRMIPNTRQTNPPERTNSRADIVRKARVHPRQSLW